MTGSFDPIPFMGDAHEYRATVVITEDTQYRLVTGGADGIGTAYLVRRIAGDLAKTGGDRGILKAGIRYFQQSREYERTMVLRVHSPAQMEQAVRAAYRAGQDSILANGGKS